MKSFKLILTASALVLFSALPQVQAAQTLSLDDLLNQVKQGRIDDAKENKQREKRFIAEKNNQRKLLKQIKAEQKKLEKQSAQMESQFDKNEAKIAKQTELLKTRLGSLKELFGVLQQSAGDARGQFENSITQLQFPDRSKFLSELSEKMGTSSQLASIEDIEHLWFELQREMTESGRVVKFPLEIIKANGDKVTQEVTRIGVFNLVSQGKYLDYSPETGRVIELPRQPSGRFLKAIEQFEASSGNEITPVGIDPSRGQILSLLVQSPSLRERVDQGGIVGYIIIGLGALALLIVLERLLVLGFTGLKVRLQMRHLDKPKKSNPLGRVLAVYYENPNADVDTLELKLGEALLHETPRLQRRVMLLKIIAAVAPLMGLLGTVTGMIITFQAITLFGTGDPKLMAGGISQALVTTVLGLVVAIPTVLLHTLVASRSKAILQVLEEQASGMIAQHAEAMHGDTGDTTKPTAEA
jgi:biopolymer transport protein ExbB